MQIHTKQKHPNYAMNTNQKKHSMRSTWLKVNVQNKIKLEF